MIGSLKEAFQVINLIPNNPADILLIFDDKNTPEAQRKAAIFAGKSEGTVMAFARGMCGVGKTCALRGCGLHRDVSLPFPDGMLYMSLGAESHKAQLIQNIANFVKYTGGAKTYKNTENENYLNTCVGRGGESFRDLICLFLIYYISFHNGIYSTVTIVLSDLAKQKKRRVSFPTRDGKLKSDGKISFQIEVSQIPGNFSYIVLFEIAPETSEYIRETLLDKTAGIPIALNVTSSRVRSYLDDDMNTDRICSDVRDEYKKNESLIEDEIHNEEDIDVFNVLLKYLTLIDDKEANKKSRDLFDAFAILCK